MRLGILGGSFSPVHNGHLALALEAVSELSLDRFYFVPTFQSPFKSKSQTWSTRLRVSCLKKTLEKYPFFDLSLFEIQRQKVSYTIDTLKHFKKTFGGQTALYLFIGQDHLKRLGEWKNIEEIFKLARVVVATRPGFASIRTPWPVLFMPFEALDISSTQIRKNIFSKEKVKNLLADGVFEWVQAIQKK